jgi:hypothetical protein
LFNRAVHFCYASIREKVRSNRKNRLESGLPLVRHFSTPVFYTLKTEKSCKKLKKPERIAAELRGVGRKGVVQVACPIAMTGRFFTAIFPPPDATYLPIINYVISTTGSRQRHASRTTAATMQLLPILTKAPFSIKNWQSGRITSISVFSLFPAKTLGATPLPPFGIRPSAEQAEQFPLHLFAREP